MLNKRGLSPILATIMLIFAAIVVGVAVMNWGRAQIEEGAKCTVDSELKFIEVNRIPQVCYSKTGFVFFLVENGPSADIVRLQLRLVGTGSKLFLSDITGTEIPANYALAKNVTYDHRSYGDVRQLRLTPRLRVFNQEQFCPEQALTIENLPLCEDLLAPYQRNETMKS